MTWPIWQKKKTKATKGDGTVWDRAGAIASASWPPGPGLVGMGLTARQVPQKRSQWDAREGVEARSREPSGPSLDGARGRLVESESQAAEGTREQADGQTRLAIEIDRPPIATLKCRSLTTHTRSVTRGFESPIDSCAARHTFHLDGTQPGSRSMQRDADGWRDCCGGPSVSVTGYELHAIQS